LDFAHTLGLNKAPESPEEERAKLQKDQGFDPIKASIDWQRPL